MGTPFDVAAGAVGFASLGLLAFQGCVTGFMIISTAQNFGQDSDILRCSLEFEQYRLFRWAEIVGLESQSPRRNLNWIIVNDILKQLERLLKDTDDFKKEYGLELLRTEDQITIEDLHVPKKGIRRLMAMVKPEFHNETARKLHKSNNLWMRLKWAVVDKEGFELLVGDVARMVDRLYEVLELNDRDFIRNGIETLLRNVVSRASTSTELNGVAELLKPDESTDAMFHQSAIHAALNLKKKKLMLGFGEEIPAPGTLSTSSTLVDAGSAPGPSIPRNSTPRKMPQPQKPLTYHLLKRELPAGQCPPLRRELAMFDTSRRVLVEWKTVDSTIESKLKHRIKSLAALLQDICLDSSFHSLRCLGYLKDPVSYNYGYVFEIPSGTSDTSGCNSLSALLHQKDLAPSLNDRYKLATALVETVLQLHTAGWLHKGIRAGNVLFFCEQSVHADITKPFLEGYEYARADNPSDMTEFVILDYEEDLYRHPGLLKIKRDPFRKIHDLYALGCVLIEIGLWTSLPRTLERVLRMEKTGSVDDSVASSEIELLLKRSISREKPRLLSQYGQGSFFELLRFAAGENYADVVKTCLTAGDKSSQVQDEDEDEDIDSDERCIDLEMDILKLLHSCSV